MEWKINRVSYHGRNRDRDHEVVAGDTADDAIRRWLRDLHCDGAGVMDGGDTIEVSICAEEPGAEWAMHRIECVVPTPVYIISEPLDGAAVGET